MAQGQPRAPISTGCNSLVSVCHVHPILRLAFFINFMPIRLHDLSTAYTGLTPATHHNTSVTRGREAAPLK